MRRRWSSSPLVHLAGGSIEVIPFAGVANLGNAAHEPRVVRGEGRCAHVRNGIVDPSMVAWTSGGSSIGEYLTYGGANGLQLATYNGSDLNTAAATDVIKRRSRRRS